MQVADIHLLAKLLNRVKFTILKRKFETLNTSLNTIQAKALQNLLHIHPQQCITLVVMADEN